MCSQFSIMHFTCFCLLISIGVSAKIPKIPLGVDWLCMMERDVQTCVNNILLQDIEKFKRKECCSVFKQRCKGPVMCMFGEHCDAPKDCSWINEVVDFKPESSQRRDRHIPHRP